MTMAHSVNSAVLSKGDGKKCLKLSASSSPAPPSTTAAWVNVISNDTDDEIEGNDDNEEAAVRSGYIWY